MSIEDNAFKKFLKTMTRNADVYTESDIPSGNLRIDFLIVKEAGEPLQNGLPEFKDKRIIIGEFKSFKDKIHAYSLSTLAAKAILVFDSALRKKTFYMFHESTRKTNRKKQEAKELTKKLHNSTRITDYAGLLILGSENSLAKINNHYSFSLSDLPKISPGVYLLQPLTNLFMEVYVILLNELPFTPRYRFLKLFSSKDDRKKVIESVIQANDELMYLVCLYLFKEEVEIMTQVLDKKIQPTKKSIKEATEIIGLENIIDAVGLEKTIQTIGLEKTIQILSQEVLKENLSETEKKKLRKQLLELLSKLE